MLITLTHGIVEMPNYLCILTRKCQIEDKLELCFSIWDFQSGDNLDATQRNRADHGISLEYLFDRPVMFRNALNINGRQVSV